MPDSVQDDPLTLDAAARRRDQILLQMLKTPKTPRTPKKPKAAQAPKDRA